MAIFRRSTNPPQYKNHRSYKPFLRVDFQFRCAYCEMTEGYLKGPDVFGADHFRPFLHFPELDCAYENLYYCCNRCNSYKGTSWPTAEQESKGLKFADPCVEDLYEVHLLAGPSGEVSPLSEIGKYTLQGYG